MPAFDRRLVRPSVVQLLECLGEASVHAGLKRDIEIWQEFLDGIRGEPEGVHRWGTRLYGVLLAWWTDADQRRHFRVQSVPATGSLSDQLAVRESDDYCPLWHVYPERVVRRLAGDSLDWMVLCDCGRGGRLGHLLWLGDRCSLCGVSPQRSVVRDLGAGAYLHQPDLAAERVAFSHDGRLVAVAGKGPFLDVWDCPSRVLVRRFAVCPGPVRAMGFLTGTPTWIAVGCDDRLLRFLRVDTGEEGEAIPTPSPLRQVEFTFGGDLLLMVAENSAEFWGRVGPAGGWRLLEDLPDKFLPLVQDDLVQDERTSVKWVKREDAGATATRVATSRDGRWVALAGEFTVRLWRCHEGRPTLHWMHRDAEHPISSLAFHERDGTLFGLWREPYQFRREGGGFRVNVWTLDRSTPSFTKEGSYKALSPVMTCGGRWILSRDEHSLCFNPTDQSRDLVRLEDHPRRRLRSVWASPDGETVASVDELGRVRLWPWRELLPVT